MERDDIMRLRKRIFTLLVMTFFAAVLSNGAAWAMDELVLTPTGNSAVSTKDKGASAKSEIVPAEEQAFNAAIKVWRSHRYSDGKKMMLDFAANYPNSRWRAQAELYGACGYSSSQQYPQAKAILQRLASEFSNTNIREKSTIRLGNIAEHEGRWDDAIQYYTSILKMHPTWDQFKYANYRARKLYMTRNALQAKINCGPVALAACLDKLGKYSEGITARSMKSTADGVSMWVLAGEAEKLGVKAQSVEMSLADLKSASFPVLAHIQPNHYIAILSMNGDKVLIEDSIQGNRAVPVSALEKKWSGKVITFAPAANLKPLSLAEAVQTTGGCCSMADEDECLGCPGDCQQASSGSGSGSSGGSSGSGGGASASIEPNKGCSSCGGGSGGIGNNGGSTCCGSSGGRPTWTVNTTRHEPPCERHSDLVQTRAQVIG